MQIEDDERDMAVFALENELKRRTEDVQKILGIPLGCITVAEWLKVSEVAMDNAKITKTIDKLMGNEPKKEFDPEADCPW